jgi:2,5-furandicarboxylate decarboxylase 1
MGKDMRSWIDQLEKAGELIHVGKEIDIEKELGAVCHSSREKSLLFSNIKSYAGWKILAQAPANVRHLGLALQIAPQRLIPELALLMASTPVKVKKVPEGPCKDRIWRGPEVDLNKLPVHIHNSSDGGRYIGSGIAVTRDPETGVHNMTIHRMMIHGKDQTGFWMLPQHTWMNFEKYRARGVPMPVSVIIGHHPAYYLAATTRGSYEMDELELAGIMLREPAEVIRSETSDVFVPANSEIVLEGEVPLNELKVDGPFGEFHGYSFHDPKPAHVFNVKTITMRKDAIFKNLQSHPLTEAGLLIRTPLAVGVYNHIKDVEGGVNIHNVAVIPSNFIVVIQITQKYEGQAKNVMLSALSSPFLHPRIAVAVDEDVDLSDPMDIFWAVSTRVNPEKDIVIIPGVRHHVNDPAFFKDKRREGALQGLNIPGSKVLIDATKPSLESPLRSKFDRTTPMGWGKVNPLDWIG